VVACVTGHDRDMPVPAALKRLDDRVLGRHRNREVAVTETEHDEHDTQTRPSRPRDGLPTFLRIFYRVCRLVLLALAAVLVLAVVLILAPANDDNGIVSAVFDLAERVAGPFKDVFTVEDDDREKIVNYAVAAVVYLVAATVVSKLPTGRSTS
jgi:hypothetical protein